MRDKRIFPIFLVSFAVFYHILHIKSEQYKKRTILEANNTRVSLVLVLFRQFTTIKGRSFRRCDYGDIWHALFKYGHTHMRETGREAWIILDDVNELSSVGISQLVKFGKMNQNHKVFKIIMATSPGKGLNGIANAKRSNTGDIKLKTITS